VRGLQAEIIDTWSCRPDVLFHLPKRHLCLLQCAPNTWSPRSLC
jgi:hypothetical protein